MIGRLYFRIGLLPAVALAALLLAACGGSPQGAAPVPVEYLREVDSYLVVAPESLRPGQTHTVSVSLFQGVEPAQGVVNLELEGQDGRALAQASGPVTGRGEVPLAVPPETDTGDYTLRVWGRGVDGGEFADSTRIDVRPAPAVLFLETDKPIYRPGQELLIRLLRMDLDLKPMPGTVVLEIQDAKGIKVFKREVEADEFGMGSARIPLSAEPNLGAWTLRAISGEQSVERQVLVEEYALPKYEITVNMPRDWLLVGDEVAGSVSAEYSFGKPVRGVAEIVASRYVGEWEEYATVTTEINGETAFELPPPEYVAGVPTAGGKGNVQLHVTVREQSTGYVEQTSRLLTVADSAIDLQLIPAASFFSPGLPFPILVVAETPGNEVVDADVVVHLRYVDEEFKETGEESIQAQIVGGTALIEAKPPEGAVAMEITAEADSDAAHMVVQGSHSPSGNFIHVEQTGQPSLEVGGEATFRVHSTSEARNFYYEVVARGRTVFSGVSRTADISFGLTPEMTPSARLVVYQILPNNEVAADYLPFAVSASYPMRVTAGFSVEQAAPGQQLDILVTTEGPARVGLTAVDRSVFILTDNRVNLRQVFAELERLYSEPRAEVHLDYLPDRVVTPGAADTFREAGLVTLSDKPVPAGLGFNRPIPEHGGFGLDGTLAVALVVVALLIVVLGLIGIVALIIGAVKLLSRISTGLFLALLVMAGAWTACGAPSEELSRSIATPAPAGDEADRAGDSGLAEVERVRQFFPETWLWDEVTTDESGHAVLPATAPDSITTWSMTAVGMSQEHGLGVANSELVVFQPFFLQVDLPYAAVRGEEFPVKVALYNYLDTSQDFVVELEEKPEFHLIDEPAKRVTVEPNEVSGVEFDIRLTTLGRVPLKVTARSQESADAVIETLLVEPEGVARESVDNAILAGGDQVDFHIAEPSEAVPGSNRTYLTLTGGYLAQTLEGLEDLLQMPYGCGEQNMILFAPNIYVARYLEASGQLRPEISAKSEFLMTTGYQRQLTYQRDDGSFSAFGQSDHSGSLWLTAFVLKSFSEADGLIYIDPAVTSDASSWIRRHQRSDGSFSPVGFVHHKDLLGGLQGNTALTAYVAAALLEAGDRDASTLALSYLEAQLEDISHAYTMAVAAYALALGGSPYATEAHERLLDMADVDGDKLYWDGAAAVETTGYAVLALLERGDRYNASRAANWLVEQRNAFGGYASTQDTVVGLQGLVGYATNAQTDVDLDVEVTAGEWSRLVTVNAANAEVLQSVEVPAAESLRLRAAGTGRAIAQVVHRFNVREKGNGEGTMFRIEVDYGVEQVAVDDLIDITTNVTFTPPEGLVADAGMVLLDVAVPTGFGPVDATVQAMVADIPQVKRREIAGRKVILYIEDMRPWEPLVLQFQARAQYPVRAQDVPSQVYSYYTPDWRDEALGGGIIVVEE